MGIVLEFGDNTTVSTKSSRSSRHSSSSPQAASKAFHPLQHSYSHAQGSHTELPRQIPVVQTNPYATNKGHSRQTSVAETNGTEPENETEALEQDLPGSTQPASTGSPQYALKQGEGAQVPLRTKPFSQVSPNYRATVLPASGTEQPGRHEAPQQPGHEDNGAAKFAPRPSLFSVLDRWRATAGSSVKADGDSTPRAASRQEPSNEPSQAISTIAPEKDDLRRNLMRLAQGYREPSAPPSAAGYPKSGAPQGAPSNQAPVGRQQMHDTAAMTGKPLDQPSSSHIYPRETTPEQNPPPNKEELLWARAVRARELHLASKFFNHWADRTARRLEREAVARRHMIRFRCFRGWSHIPSSRAPAIDQMKATSATQKLRRAVHNLEEPLQIAASAALWSYRQKLVTRALMQWRCRVQEDIARRDAATRNQKRAMTRWLHRATDAATVDAAVIRHRNQASELNTSIKWRGLSEQNDIRHKAAAQIGAYRSSFAYLSHWWDYTEVRRRAQEFQEMVAKDKASFWFLTWNLSARAQAFQWKLEFTAINKAFQIWATSAQEDVRARERASQISQKNRQARSLKRLRPLGPEEDEMTRLQKRARLYICSTRLLETFEKTIQRRKAQEKKAVKTYLMMRYQQVSRTRKKRNFFRALDHWAALAALGQKQAAEVEKLELQRESMRRVVAFDVWAQQTEQDLENDLISRSHHARSVARQWADLSMSFEEKYLQSRSMHVADMQGQYQRVWSMSTLQQSGRAHTATVSRQRRDRGKRNKALEQWKTRYLEGRTAGNPPSTSQTPRFGSSSALRGARRSLAMRRPYSTRSEDFGSLTAPTDTPTRWTGQLFPPQSLFSASVMPPVEETDEQSTVSSGFPDIRERAKSPTEQTSGYRASTALPSTTPKGPVPAHLQQSRRPGPSAATPATQPNLSSSRPGHTLPGRSSMSGRRLENAYPSKSVNLSESSRLPKANSPFKPTALQSRSLGSGAQQFRGASVRHARFKMPAHSIQDSELAE